MQLLCDGKPAKNADVEGVLVGSSDKKENAFKGKTDDRGFVAISPLQPGYWLLKTKHAYSHPDQKMADEVVLAATLTFRIDD